MPKKKTPTKKKKVAAPKRKKKAPVADDGIPMATAYLDPGATQQLPVHEVIGQIEEHQALDKLKDE